MKEKVHFAIRVLVALVIIFGALDALSYFSGGKINLRSWVTNPLLSLMATTGIGQQNSGG